MEKLKRMLQEKYPTIDFDNEKSLATSGILDSIQIVEIIADMEELFDISVSMEYIQPSYFESLESMWEIVEELS